ncbi:DUF6476 family protein [Marinibacterium profundimaris]|uniref:Uncharacterized protein n=1 Tax=Marinibacterium profundimaris TaxID=1679460 RepID=A0A225NDC9_9RHOB|nr:DUF6476 family protein [Marinibacterium profundimaris]OWU69877.1 hypothetical protein ATO3_21665 [Marinibacterium profundimaris]
MEPLPSEDDYVEPANLRFLRRLVTVLTTVMIGGLVIVVGLLVIRYQRPAPLPLPDEIALPEGTAVQAVTYGPDFYLVVTQGREVLVYDRGSGTLRKTLALD